MDVSELLNDLNKPQRDAVAAALGHARILAGAGSGKTRVLVHRIAWLIQAEALSPYNILAVTFTNKAASEMRGRIEDMLGYPIGGMWVGTFHGLGHRLLRAHWKDADLPQSFQILDSDDQQRMLKRLIRSMELDEAQWPAKQAQWYINAQKDEGLRAKHIQPGHDPYSQKMLEIYQAYEQACQRAGVVDFGEILLRSHELWLKRPDILANYQQRFQQILVDEFQDTNTIQYAWLRLLAGGTGDLFIVGDDDQSIYGWRGARIENIQKFHQDYPEAATIRLEQNYRSTGHILAAANAVIANNTERLGKELWTEGEEGKPIQLYTAFNERDEASYLVEQIKIWVENGGNRADNAVLYRSNAQSRVIEEALLQANMPYRVYGGLRFFERAEIKDVLSYLRLIANRNDDAAFERIVNTPTRGIGMSTLTQLRHYAREQNVTLWQSCIDLIKSKFFTARANNALTAFLNLIDSMTPEVDMPLNELCSLVIDESGLRAHHGKDKSEKGQSRIENLDELINATRQYQHTEETKDMPLLDAFLAHAALEAGENQAGKWEDCVQLMTLHSAKGLEFPVVFMIGMEEGLFPGQKSSDDPTRLAEERRLCYVGMTRARQVLYLLQTESRFLYGQEMSPTPSRFLSEIPAECVEEVRARRTVINRGFAAANTQTQATVTTNETGFMPGEHVLHQKFGPGTVVDTEGAGKHSRIQVNFKHAGSKWLVLTYAKLERI